MSDTSSPPAPTPGAAPEMAVCALPGCDVEFPRRQGGRPRLYCSDGHRAEAHRRRRSGPEDPETLVRRLLASIGQTGSDAAGETALAEARAEAAAELARARSETAQALGRAEAAEAALAEREDDAEALAAELARARTELESTRAEVARALEEATFERHVHAQRAREDLALVRAEHAAERAAWAQERRALLERYETARYEAARAEAAAEAAERRADEAQGSADEMRTWAEIALAQERTATAERHAAQEAAAEARRQAMAADAERLEASARTERAEAETAAMREDRHRLDRMVRELELALAGERREHSEALDVLRARLGRAQRALQRSQLRGALMRSRAGPGQSSEDDTPARRTGRNRKGSRR